MAAVRDHLESFGDDTDIIVITFTEPPNVERYSERQSLPFPVLIDSERDAYQTFGIGRGTVRRVWGWRAARRYLEIFRTHGFQRLERATDDTLQLGGNFIVDPNGLLIYGYWGEGPDDRPEVQSLIDAVRIHRQSTP